MRPPRQQGTGAEANFDRGDDGNQFKLDEIVNADAHLLGRVTYESFANAWPKREGPFADRLNADPKYVVSSTLSDPEWNNTTVLSGDAMEEVARLKQSIDGNILVAGSLQLVQEMIENDLVDEIRLMVFPVVLGTGRKLFTDTSDKKDMQLV